MEIKQFNWIASKGWQPDLAEAEAFPADLVFIFGAYDRLNDHTYYHRIHKTFPRAILFGCSTAGEICDIHVADDSIAVTAVRFLHTSVLSAAINISDVKDSYDAGHHLSRCLRLEGLKHVLILSDGLKVNGSYLVEGLRNSLPTDVVITGGLAADGARFRETLVIGNQPPRKETVAILGLYGEKIKIGCGSLGGWDAFGPERLITASRDNVLYEMDGKSALELYKTYLGNHAAGLPATGLLYPLCLREKEGGRGLVRTVLSVDEEEKSMTFVGNLPEGSYVRLMKANFDRLIDGAADAAQIAIDSIAKQSPDLAILISCVGRKMVLKQRVEEEVEGVREVLGQRTALTGFYSYGEIAPFNIGELCELHNQTMTITSLWEE